MVLKPHKFIALLGCAHGQYSRSSIFAPFFEVHCKQALPSERESSSFEGEQTFFSINNNKTTFFLQISGHCCLHGLHYSSIDISVRILRRVLFRSTIVGARAVLEHCTAGILQFHVRRNYHSFSENRMKCCFDADTRRSSSSLPYAACENIIERSSN